MKSFKQYLTESKKSYGFKIKLAGDYEKDTTQKIKEALAKYDIESCSTGKRAPIEKSPVDFPDHNNINVTVFDVILNYPTNSVQVREELANKLNITSSCIKVRGTSDIEEEHLNHQFDEKSGESLLSKDFEESNNQILVGTDRSMSLLKELDKIKSCGEQVKGVNDELLAKSVPSEKVKGPAETAAKTNNVSTVGSNKVKLPSLTTAKGK